LHLQVTGLPKDFLSHDIETHQSLECGFKVLGDGLICPNGVFERWLKVAAEVLDVYGMRLRWFAVAQIGQSILRFLIFLLGRQLVKGAGLNQILLDAQSVFIKPAQIAAGFGIFLCRRKPIPVNALSIHLKFYLFCK
jgi:hypothetical protein